MESGTQTGISVERKLVKTHFSAKPHPWSFPVSLAVILVCTVISVAHWRQWPGSQYLVASGDRVFEHGEFWRLFSSIFVHADLGHLLSNSYMLAILGFLAFGYFGFRLYPLYAVILSAGVNALALLTYEPHVRLIGASGMVYLLGGFWLLMFIFIERKHTLRVRLARALGVGLVIFFPSVYEPGVSYQTHLIGMLVGMLFAIFYFLLNKKTLRQSERFQLILDEEGSEMPTLSP